MVTGLLIMRERNIYSDFRPSYAQYAKLQSLGVYVCGFSLSWPCLEARCPLQDSLAARYDSRPRRANIVNNEKVLAVQVVVCQLENLADIFLPLPAILVGLAFDKSSSSHDLGKDGEVSQLGYSLGYFLALVVASFLLSFGGERDGDDAVDVVEEVYSHSFLRQEMPHLVSHFGSMVVFQLVKDVARGGMSFVIEKGASFLYGNLVPEQLGHLVLVGILPGIGSGEMQVASHADGFFLAR